MIPLGWHVQRSDIPGGRRRGSKTVLQMFVLVGAF
jgi:hypothetical protein